MTEITEPTQPITQPQPQPVQPVAPQPPIQPVQLPPQLPLNKFGLWGFILAVGVVPGVYLLAVIIGLIVGATVFDGNDTQSALTGFFSPFFAVLIAFYINFVILIIALTLSIIGITRKGERNGLGIAALIVSGLGVLISLWPAISFSQGIFL